MRWEPIAAMVLILALGIWLVAGPLQYFGLPPRRDGAILQDLRIGPLRGSIETVHQRDQEPTFRLLFRDGTATPILTHDELAARIGEGNVDQLLTASDNSAFKLFNITAWRSLIWVGAGLLGQGLFFARMAIQWIKSEREQASVVPPIFWYFSLTGGVCLFTYFVWRQDFVGVLGQTSGIVIYARNIRLISKQRRRDVPRPSGAPGAGGPTAETGGPAPAG